MSLSSRTTWIYFSFLNVYMVTAGEYDLDVSDYLQFHELKHVSYNLRNTELLFKSIYARADTFKYSFFP